RGWGIGREAWGWGLGGAGREVCWPRGGRRPSVEPDRPPATAVGHTGLPPSGTRLSRSAPRRSRFRSDLAETPPPRAHTLRGTRGIQSPASPAAARAPRAATPRPRRRAA